MTTNPSQADARTLPADPLADPTSSALAEVADAIADDHPAAVVEPMGTPGRAWQISSLAAHLSATEARAELLPADELLPSEDYWIGVATTALEWLEGAPAAAPLRTIDLGSNAIEVHVDPDLPPDVIELRGQDGVVFSRHKIATLATDAAAEIYVRKMIDLAVATPYAGPEATS